MPAPAHPPRVWNFGSVNVDHVYAVPRFVRPGETLASSGYARGPGGKGFNQSIALARAGADVCHLGLIGADGLWLRDLLAAERVDVRALQVDAAGVTGHALIQVTPNGENSILLHGGANRALRPEMLPAFLGAAQPGDRFLCQNETNLVPEAIRLAHERGLEVWFNPAPMTPEVRDYPLERVDWLVVNETEGAELTGSVNPEEMLRFFETHVPNARVVITLGGDGVWLKHGAECLRVPARTVPVVDTTAAGDTFIGYLIAALALGRTVDAALRWSTAAAAVTVSRRGAADSIPQASEVKSFLGI